METINVKKVGKSKFGEYLQDNEDKFHSSTQQVNGFLSNQVPCQVEIIEKQDISPRKDVITRVKVLNKMAVAPQDNSVNEFEQPVEVVKVTDDGMVKAENYKPSKTYSTDYQERQKSIVAQSSIKGAFRMIELYNQIKDEKIPPTKANILTNAEIVKSVYDKLMEDNNLPDY